MDKERIKKKLFSLELNNIIDLIVLTVIFAFLLDYFKPSLLLSTTITSGGDTASHYYSAYFMKNYLLPHGRLIGWTYGNYAGFPMFQFYFFLPFLIMAIASYVIPLQIAFKLVTVTGIFLLPPAAYILMRRMRFRFPIPAFAAAFTLPFLFMEANSMWGGNIPSTLAGEFSYSISMALTVIYLGLLHREMTRENRSSLLLVIVIVMMTLTHVYTLLFAVFSSTFFLFEKDRERFIGNLLFLSKIYLLGFLLTAFWAVPTVGKLSYTTPFAVVWDIKNLQEVFPKALWPFYLLAILGVGISMLKRDRRIEYISFSIVVAFFLYSFSTKLGIVDIRFIPFIQLFPLFIAAYGLGELTGKLRGDQLLPLIVVIATIFWVGQNVTFIPQWIKWNYEGFENKAVWSSYNGVNQYLKGSAGDPRVVYEHSQLHNSAGTERAFESLPLFSGRGTLEGLYMQSTVTSPFVFYIQSEISQVTSCPFPQWSCTTFNPTNGARHLEMFNVKHVIARTDQTKKALDQNENYELKKVFGPYSVYELLTNRDRYVVVPDFQPVLFETERWKEISHLWFSNMDTLDIPLVFTTDVKRDGEEFNIFKTDGSLSDLPRVPIIDECSVDENISKDEITFRTDCVGLPHIIRVSYYPNWKVEGAKKIYLVSPSFMLVYPSQEKVRIYYGRANIDNFAMILTLIGIGALFFEKRIDRLIEERLPRTRVEELIDTIVKYKKWIALILVILLLGALVIHANSQRKARHENDLIGMQLALAAKSYPVCEHRIKDKSIMEECYKEVGIATNDYNLCDVRIEDQALRDECFNKIGIQTNDWNLCAVKILSQRLKDECFRDVGVKTGDLNLCLSRISSQKLKEECVEKIQK